MRVIFSRIVNRIRDDRGDAMAIVLLMSLVMVIVAVSMFARAASSENQVLENTRSSRALHVAEAGIDHTLFRSDQDAAFTTGEIVPASFASEAAERDWVLTQTADDAVVSISGGEWVAIKPSNLAVIYSVGYVPSRAEAAEVRVVRVTFEVGKFISDVAVLAGGDLTISGNPHFSGTSGSAHSNGNVVVSGSVTASGFLAASADYTVTGSVTTGDEENTGGGKPLRSIPEVDPRNSYSTSEYDLCPGGFVRAGPAYTSGPELPNTSGVPCMGTVLADDADEEAFRGWMLSGSNWTYSGNTAYDGVYYVYQGNAIVSGAPGDPTSGAWKVTILVEAVEGGPGHCPHTGGDLIVSGTPRMHPHAKGQNLLAVAGRDMSLSGNYNDGEVSNYTGVIAAHEQLEVSGNPQIVGTLIVEDVCDTDSSPVHDATISGNPTIIYNGGLELEAQNLRVTLWTEI